MNTNPLISILIPVRNGEQYLRECINSIVSQTYKEWECIVVNDHSTDNTWEILKGYVASDQRIKCYESDGTGIISALRTAYSKSNGAYLTRMDADDIMLSQKLELLIEGLLQNGNGHLATGGVEYFSAEGIGGGYQSYADWLNGLTRTGSNWDDLYKECVIPSPCWMLSRVDFDRVGAFDSDRYPEDYDLTFRMYAAGLKIVPCDTILHRWRDYPQRTSRNDPNYADNRFLELKLHWFAQLELSEGVNVIVWGAGKKGKQIAKDLINRKVDFTWVTDNLKKVGKEIYGQVLELPAKVSFDQKTKVIVSVANRTEQSEIVERLDSCVMVRGQHYFLFC